MAFLKFFSLPLIQIFYDVSANQEYSEHARIYKLAYFVTTYHNCKSTQTFPGILSHNKKTAWKIKLVISLQKSKQRLYGLFTL